MNCSKYKEKTHEQLQELIQQKDNVIERQAAQLARLRKTVASQRDAIRQLQNEAGITTATVAKQPPTNNSANGGPVVAKKAPNDKSPGGPVVAKKAPNNSPSGKLPAKRKSVDSETVSSKRTRKYTKFNPDNWDGLYERLAAFRSQHAHAAPKQEKDPELHEFYEGMRRYFRLHVRGESTPLTDAQIQKLRDIGFFYQSNDMWSVRFEQLKAHYKEHGDFAVSRHLNFQLWGWIKTQRASYRRYLQKQANPDQTIPTSLTIIAPEHMAKLQAIGFPWEVQKTGYEASWEKRFSELLAYRARNGHTHVPRRYSENPQLGQWCKDQRQKYNEVQKGRPRRGMLTEERVERLNNLGFQWHVNPSLKQEQNEEEDVAPEQVVFGGQEHLPHPWNHPSRKQQVDDTNHQWY